MCPSGEWISVREFLGRAATDVRPEPDRCAVRDRRALVAADKGTRAGAEAFAPGRSRRVPVGEGGRRGRPGHSQLRPLTRANGRKRSVVTVTLGLLVCVWVLVATWQDRPRRRKGRPSGGLRRHSDPVRVRRPGLRWPSGRWVPGRSPRSFAIVRKSGGQEGFVVHPRRRVAEPTLVWLVSYRRLARDYKRHPAVSEALIR